MSHYQHPHETRIIRQVRNSIELLLDGAYRQIEVLHRMADGNFDIHYESSINELLEHAREEVESRVIHSSQGD